VTISSLGGIEAKHGNFFDLRYSMLLLEIFFSVSIPRTKVAGVWPCGAHSPAGQSVLRCAGASALEAFPREMELMSYPYIMEAQEPSL